jgi:hypothetical protein
MMGKTTSRNSGELREMGDKGDGTQSQEEFLIVALATESGVVAIDFATTTYKA